MTRALSCVLSAVLLAACHHAHPVADRYVTYSAANDVRPVGDVEGHVAGSFTNHGVCLKRLGRADEDVGVLRSTGTFDAVFTSAGTTSRCVLGGRTTCTFPDGSSHTDEWSGTCRLEAGGLMTSEGRATYVAGTGRFEGISGGGTFSGKALVAPPEDLWITRVLLNEEHRPRR